MFGTKLMELTTKQLNYLMRQLSKIRQHSNGNLFRKGFAMCTIGNCLSKCLRSTILESRRYWLIAATRTSLLSALKFLKRLHITKSSPNSLTRLEPQRNYCLVSTVQATWGLTIKEIQITTSTSSK